MALSIRSRLTLWSSLVTLGVLAAASIVLSELHERHGLTRLHQSVDAAIQTAGAVMRNELDEGLSLRAAAADAVSELDIPGTGLAFLDAQGTLLDMRVSDARPLPAASLAATEDRVRTVFHDGEEFRARSSPASYRSHRYRVVAWRSMAPFESDRAAFRRALALTLPLGVLLAAAGGSLIGRRALRPLSDMAAQAGRMGHRRLDDRLQYGQNHDELSVLGSAFNDLLDRLSGALREQRTFMADASHQLRTPLSIARTAADVTLSKGVRTAAEYRDALTVIAEQTHRLTRIVEDMFALALADADARPLHLQRLYLEDLIAGSVRSMRVLAERKAITVKTRVDKDCQVAADEELLRQMLLNLLENATRHSFRGGRVEIETTCDEGAVRLCVRDSGPGVPEADWERIFERFVRLDPGIGEGGGGLGLPIARWIAQLHGGTLRIVASSQSGTTFEARLPILVGAD